jgi:high-affinity nickel permease
LRDDFQDVPALSGTDVALTFTYLLNTGNKVVIANQTKHYKKVATDYYMDDYCSCLPLLRGKQVWWKI